MHFGEWNVRGRGGVWGSGTDGQFGAIHTCTHMYRHMHTLESLPTVAPVEDCAHPTTDSPSHSQQTILTISIIPIFIFGLVTVIALVSCLWLYFHYYIYTIQSCVKWKWGRRRGWVKGRSWQPRGAVQVGEEESSYMSLAMSISLCIILCMPLTHDFRPTQQAHCLVPKGLQLLTLCVERKRDRQSWNLIQLLKTGSHAAWEL